MNEAVSPGALSTLFTDARTHNGWRETPVSDETFTGALCLMKWGPTSANCSPARFVFIRTAEGKERLRPALSSGNLQKTLTAPVTAIVAWDSEFYETVTTAVSSRRCPQLVYLQPTTCRRNSVSQQFHAGGLSDRRLPCAGAGYRPDVGF